MRLEIPKLPTESNGNRKIDPRRERLAAQSLFQAKAIAELDRRIGGDLDPERDIVDTKSIAILPDRVKDALQEAAITYRNMQDEATRELSYIEGQLGLERKPKPAEFGSYYFKKRTGSLPIGTVSLERKGAYLVIHCHHPEDYARMSVGENGDPYSDTARKSGGTFHRAMAFTDPLLEHLPVLLIRGPASEWGADATVAHERQHFINHMLAAYPADTPFKNVERRPSPFSKIKDEVLAFLRDGSGAIGSKRKLGSPIYEHLFETLDDEQRAIAWDAVAALDAFVQRHWERLQTDKERAVLVYQLIGIPLDRFYAWLPLFSEYSKKLATERKEPTEQQAKQRRRRGGRGHYHSRPETLANPFATS